MLNFTSVFGSSGLCLTDSLIYSFVYLKANHLHKATKQLKIYTKHNTQQTARMYRPILYITTPLMRDEIVC